MLVVYRRILLTSRIIGPNVKDVRMLNRKFSLFALVIISAVVSAEQVQIDKVIDPSVVMIDRRPEKDIRYPRCLGIFRTVTKAQYPAGVELSDGKCPEASATKFEVLSKERATADNGKTGIEKIRLDEKTFVSQYVDENKTPWGFQVHPTKITVKVPSIKDPSNMVEDSFYVARMKDETNIKGLDNPSQMVVCGDISSAEACFKSRIVGRKTDDKSTVHATIPAAEGKEQGRPVDDRTKPDTH